MIEAIPPISAIEPPKRPDIEPPQAPALRAALDGGRRFIIQFAPGTPLPDDDEIACTDDALKGIIPDDVQRSLTFTDATAWLCRLYPAQLGADMDEQASANRDNTLWTDLPAPGFARYYRLRFTGGMEDSYIADTLARASTIAAVQPEFSFAVTASAVTHADPDYPKQDYLIAAPKGISVTSAWDEGSGGKGIAIGMSEAGSSLVPSDIVIKTPLGLGSTASAHMVSVAGIMVAKDNDQGTVGVSPLSDLVFSATDAKPTSTAALSPSPTLISDDHYRAIALLNSTAALKAGDIINLSIGAILSLDQKKNPAIGPTLPVTYPGHPGLRIVTKTAGAKQPDVYEQIDSIIPLEIDPAVLKLVQQLTLKGITVCMAAGNGYRSTYIADTTKRPDLDTKVGAKLEETWLKQIHTLNRADAATFKDGGSIVVAAGYWSNNKTVNQRLQYSNSGSRVDCFAQGAIVKTWGPSGTVDFSGTSAACPIVAGAAALVQCYLRQNYQLTLKPLLLRALLSDPLLNTPAQAGDQIGLMPNLGKLIPLLKTSGFSKPDLIAALKKNASDSKAATAKTKAAAGAAASTAGGWVHDPYTLWNEVSKAWDPMPVDTESDMFNPAP